MTLYIQIAFNGSNWQVYSIISDKQKLPKSKLKTIYNKVYPFKGQKTQ